MSPLRTGQESSWARQITSIQHADEVTARSPHCCCGDSCPTPGACCCAQKRRANTISSTVAIGQNCGHPDLFTLTGSPFAKYLLPSASQDIRQATDSFPRPERHLPLQS